MNPFADLIKELNIPEDKLGELASAIQNPFTAMQKMQELNIPPEFLQKMMALVMSNPQALFDFAKQLGVEDDKLQQAKDMMKAFMPK